MKKAARITGIVLGCVFLIICALPFVGAAVNIADGHIRADRAEKLISDMGGEICDSFVYTGNTSGTEITRKISCFCGAHQRTTGDRKGAFQCGKCFCISPFRSGGALLYV